MANPILNFGSANGSIFKPRSSAPVSNLSGSFSTVDELQLWAFEQLIKYGAEVSPRGDKSYEILSIAFELTNPRARITNLTNRKWSHALAIGEFCWHLRGEKQVDGLAYYAPRWRTFANAHGEVEGSCYGYRIFEELRSEFSQWDWATSLLRKDPHSRRAIIDIQGQDLLSNSEMSHDVSCATSMQFFIRNEKLHASVNMRSNDVYWGLPYDIYLFTMLQELMSEQLQIELGTYYHHVGSLHFYDRHIKKIHKILHSDHQKILPMAEMNNSDLLNEFLEIETMLRQGDYSSAMLSDTYWAELLKPVELFCLKKSS